MYKFLQQKKVLISAVPLEKINKQESEMKKIYPNEEDKKDALEKIIKDEITKEFYVLLQKPKFNEEDSNKVREFVKSYIKLNKYFFQSPSDHEDFIEMIVNDIFGLGVLEQYINDPEVEEIWVLGPKKIYIDRKGRRELAPLKFKNEKIIVSMINKILAPINRKADESTPTVDARLKDGSRVAITMSPVSFHNGSEIVIRKFKKEKFLLPDYVHYNSMNQRMANFLDNAVRMGANILVVGGTSSGKTTLLNALTNCIPNDRGEEHIITIEDSAELIVHSPFLQSWETKNPNAEGKGAVTIRDLIKHALRNSPDRIIVGELRGAEAYDLLQASITGHKGCMATIHADNAARAVDRFATLAASAGIITAESAKELFSSAFDIIVVLERLENTVTHQPVRVITQICSVVGYGAQGAEKLKYSTKNLTEREQSRVYLQDIYKINKKDFTFETTGYIPEDLCKKADLDARPFDPMLFVATKKKQADNSVKKSKTNDNNNVNNVKKTDTVKTDESTDKESDDIEMLDLKDFDDVK